MAGRQLVAAVSAVLLITFMPGLLIFCTYAQLDAAFSASCLPEDVLAGIATREILGHQITLNPEHVASFVFSTWVLPSVVFAGFADLQTYGLRRWTRRLRRDRHAARLISSLWMQESKLGDYYQLIHRGFRSRQRRAYARGR